MWISYWFVNRYRRKQKRKVAMLADKSASPGSVEMSSLSSHKAEADQIKQVTKWAIKFDNGEMHRYTDEQVQSPSWLRRQGRFPPNWSPLSVKLAKLIGVALWQHPSASAFFADQGQVWSGASVGRDESPPHNTRPCYDCDEVCRARCVLSPW